MVYDYTLKTNHSHMKHLKSINSGLIKVLYVLFISLGVLSMTLAQQQVQEKYESIVKLKNGNEFRGEVKSETDSTLVLVVAEIGEMTIKKSQISSIVGVGLK